VKGNRTEPAIAPPGHDVPAGFFSQDVVTVARGLIGITLLVNGVGGPIAETEAYDAADPASHSYRGRSARNGSVFGPPGYAYVYCSYGIHWCLNLVCGAEVGGAVLIRALQPINGVDVMAERRGTTDLRVLCSGPGGYARHSVSTAPSTADHSISRRSTSQVSLSRASRPVRGSESHVERKRFGASGWQGLPS
jgi:3-methyladenine DNA glycosylase Mpg